MALPVLDLGRLPPGRLTMPYLSGGAVEGGRTLSGAAILTDMTGGGLVMIKYASLQLGNTDPARLRYLSQLAAMLNSGARSILVPLLVDFIQPKVGSTGVPVRTFFTDGRRFSDGMRFTQPSMSALSIMTQAAALNAGTVTLNIGSRDLTGGEWFEIVHPTKLNRVYCVTDIDSSVANPNGTRTVTVGISPPLREAVTAPGMPINFDRPKCVMQLEPGTKITADVQGAWWATPDISFVESFGTT